MTADLPRGSLAGESVLRVEWLPGSDRVRGRCHCGAEAEAEEPAAMWEWLLAHPDHPAGGPGDPGPRAVPPPAAADAGPPVRVPALV